MGKLYNVRRVDYREDEMNTNKFLKTSVIAIAMMLAGCTSDYSGNRYDGSAVGEVQRTEKGQVISLRKVELKPEKSMAGTALGAVGGGLVGSAFGGGHAKLLTATAGAVAGGVAGNAIATRAQDGIEYTVKLDSGAIVTIAQAPTPAISVGQRVHVIYSQKGRSRVVPE
ncbi:MAG: glycine zipper 2TM domain-containing protein [Alphaproteobacteria bacterium]|nr:glycine zipper 2TM domain-containing protein [Alphaproteobacteria bacterium]